MPAVVLFSSAVGVALIGIENKAQLLANLQVLEQANALMEKHRVRTPEFTSTVDILVPMAFAFPNAGKLLTLLFVPYAAWLTGNPLELEGYVALFGGGIFAYFAKAQVAPPFLLDLVQVPQDHFQLYIPTTIITGKFDSMVSAMSLLAFSLMGAGAMTGFLRVAAARVFVTLAVVAAALACAVVGTRILLGTVVDTSYRKAELLKRMHAPRTALPAIVHKDRATVTDEPALRSMPALERVRARGLLRVGYDPANPPFSFFNADGELAGFDLELVQGLAEALGVQAEMIPVRWSKMPKDLADGAIDAMLSVWYRPFWFSSVRLSDPYLIGTFGLIVHDERRHEFTQVETLRRSRGLKIGVPLVPSQPAFTMQRYFGGSDAQFVTIETPTPFVEGRHPDVDAFLWPAEGASAATLLHPEYSVVVPQPDPVKVAYAFGVALDSGDLVDVINEWIVVATNVGAIQRAYDYWILGKGAEQKQRRWSIMRDVLGWGQ